LRAILQLLVQQLNANMKDRRISVALLPQALDWLINVTCRDRSYGRGPSGGRSSGTSKTRSRRN